MQLFIRTSYHRLLIICAAVVMLSACRKGAQVVPSTDTQVQEPEPGKHSFYILNEGNMGMNLASLDFFNSSTGKYSHNIYNQINPTATKELGDVGNDIQIYGSKLYAVINMSDKVEIMNAYTAKRIGQITIRNCRYVTFYKDKAYVSSYAAALGDSQAGEGFVAEIDTATLEITRTVTVGRQPEEMAVVGSQLYVANSGGYSPPDYERTVSVIDLSTFTETKRIDVAINLHRLKADRYGDLYVTSRGDYYGIPSKLFIISTQTDKVKDSLDIAAGNIWMHGDSAYIYSTEWSYITNSNVVTYAIVNVKDETTVSRNFITDGTEKNIRIPYGLAVDPSNGDIYLTDAKDYVMPGTLYCFNREGKKKWSVTTGDIPAHFVFLP